MTGNKGRRVACECYYYYYYIILYYIILYYIILYYIILYYIILYYIIKLRGLSPRADYTDRAAAAGRRS